MPCRSKESVFQASIGAAVFYIFAGFGVGETELFGYLLDFGPNCHSSVFFVIILFLFALFYDVGNISVLKGVECRCVASPVNPCFAILAILSR